MSNFIPKEQLSAYQRWELNSLDEPLQESADLLPQAGVPMPTAEEVEAIHRRAHQEGYAAGYQEGKARTDAELAQLAQLASSLEGALNQFDEEMMQSLLTLSLDVAKQMLREALRVRPELALPAIREAVSSLPQVSQHPHIKLNPDDAALVRSLMADELSSFHWKLIEDARIERGGCRIETVNSEADATMESRWERVLAVLGREGAWLE
ncbi:MAG: flagellar assembly protein FliH [Betaproteobacteria bacterium]|nr:flagellar assembly protein FliH [Betaproteobacteria bacterium]